MLKLKLPGSFSFSILLFTGLFYILFFISSPVSTIRSIPASYTSMRCPFPLVVSTVSTKLPSRPLPGATKTPSYISVSISPTSTSAPTSLSGTIIFMI